VDELLQQFVIEALELTQQASEDLLALERDPSSRPHLESAFRAFHTLKGSVGLFDLVPMQRVLHAAEDRLSTVLKGPAAFDTGAIDPLLEILEWTESCVRQLTARGALDAGEPARASALLGALAGGPVSAGGNPEPAAPQAIPDWAKSLLDLDPSPNAVAFRYEPPAECFFSGDDPVALMASVPGIIRATIALREPWAAADILDPFRSNLIFHALSLAPQAEIEAVFRLVPDQVSIVPRPQEGLAADASIGQQQRTLRVGVEHIDRLVDGIGELLAAKNAMTALVDEAKRLPGGLPLSRSISLAQQTIDRLAGQLQRAALRVRMVPLSEVMRRLPRLVREVSGQVGKRVDLVVEGGEIEADKAIVDALYDPLLHILRNAIDHGVETPPLREQAGKPPRGTIRIVARQLGYRVELRIADDGAGVDLDRVRSIAVVQGLIDPARAAQLSAIDAHELLFLPGFSTAATLTDVSGRGVGMDAVRSAVERLGGSVDLSSERGRGTTVTLSLPLSSAMTRVMVVDAAGDRYGLPMDAISETTRIPAAAISPIRAGEAFVLRDRTVPIVRLADLLGQPRPRRDDELVLVADTGAGAVGVIVDAIGERFETVLRPPTGLMKSVPGVSGTTVLGNGKVIMILNLGALIQ